MWACGTSRWTWGWSWAKGPAGNWFHVTDGTVYFDHPVHAMAEHTLNIDFSAPAKGPGNFEAALHPALLPHAAGRSDVSEADKRPLSG